MSEPAHFGIERHDPEGFGLTAAVDSGPPDEPSLPVGKWLRKNLFSTPFNTALTLVFTVLSLAGLRGLLNFAFSEERNWDAVRINLRLLFTQAYPEEQYARVWVSVGIVVALAGLTLGLWARLRGVPVARLAMWSMTAGGLIALGTVLREPSALTGPDGSPLLDATESVIRQSFGAAMADRIWWWLAAAVLFAVGAGLWRGFEDERRRHTYVPTIPLVFGFLGLVVAALWLYPWGHYAFTSDAGFVYQPGRSAALSTKLPWTVMCLVLMAGWAAGRLARDAPTAPRLKVLVNLTWLLSPFILFWVVLRDPDIDWPHVWSTDLPMAVGFAVGGGAVLYGLTRPGLGEAGRVIAVALLAFAGFNWVAAFAGWYPMLQKARFGFLLLALAALLAPNFVGERAQRLRLVWGWVGAMVVFHYLVTMANTASTLNTPTSEFLGGFSVTLFVAVFTLVFSFPMGVLLALGRNSSLSIFRLICTGYIELVRSVPLITWLFFGASMLVAFLPQGVEFDELVGVIGALAIFSSAYVAVNIQGGLQAVGKGQYEAAQAVGLSTVQSTSLIILPQAIRTVIPALVSHIIVSFKDTSLVAIIGLTDVLLIARSAIPQQSNPSFQGTITQMMFFMALFYWVFTYAFSKMSRRYERSVGLGER